jgi:ribosomal protein L11 methyltransferase
MAPDGAADLQKRISRQLEDLAGVVEGLNTQQPEVIEVRTEDWAENWKQHFQAVRIGERLVIRPSWEAFEAKAGDVVVTLDPGMAFGTGTHGTTRLCLEALAGLFAGPVPPARVLDVGTGSGILAIASAALGARRVLACDIEPEACRTAHENARQNGLTDRIEVTGAPLESLEEDFDLVLANILAEENVRLAAALVGRLAPGGHLVLSGILEEKEAMVTEGFRNFPLDGPTVSRREEWCCLVYRRRP